MQYAGPLDRVMQPGDQFAMLIECADKSGYYSEAMPTICIGDIPAPLQRAFDEVVEIQEELAATVRPGLLPSNLLAADDRYRKRTAIPTGAACWAIRKAMIWSSGPLSVPAARIRTGHGDFDPPHHPRAASLGYPNNMSFHLTAAGMTRMLKTPQKIFMV